MIVNVNTKKSVEVEFIVINGNSKPILGLNTCVTLDLIKRINNVNSHPIKNTHDSNYYCELLQKFDKCFGEIGCLKYMHQIDIDPSVKPSISYRRKIPFMLKPKLEEEFKRMVRTGVIEEIHEPSDWVNTLVVVEKPNGRLRVCLDPRPLNTAIKKEQYMLPTAEEIMSDMAGVVIFSKLDASAGYWQIRLDETCLKLTTFGTPFGRFKFTRLPFGIHSASEVFQKEVAEIIEGISSVRNSQDDILVWDRNKNEHDATLNEVLQRILDSGLRLNRDKCKFGVTELIFFRTCYQQR